MDRFSNLADGVLAPGSKLPDVAVRDLHARFPEALGKEPIRLDKFLSGSWARIDSGIAIGFPTLEKKSASDANGTRVMMPSVYAVADPGTFDPSADVARFRSELPSPPVVTNLRA